MTTNSFYSQEKNGLVLNSMLLKVSHNIQGFHMNYIHLQIQISGKNCYYSRFTSNVKHTNAQYGVVSISAL